MIEEKAASSPGPPKDPLIGKLLDGRFRVDGILGKGGMGTVYRGTQTSVSRGVAIKTLHPQLALSQAFFERFKREAEIASRLHHPNIVTVFDFGKTADNLCYIVMELLEGQSLRQKVKAEGPMSLQRAIDIVKQVARGLAHSHSVGVIHRDLKPHNIMIHEVDGRDAVKVLDFGLVKAVESEVGAEQLTSTGQVLGTPQYMPPEQAGGEDVDVRSDLYSLTGVFYFCLTGTSPFGATTVRKALAAGLKGEVAPVMTHRQGAPVPEGIDRFIKKGLSPNREHRFDSCQTFMTELDALLFETPDSHLLALPTGGAHQVISSPSRAPASASAQPAQAQHQDTRPEPRGQAAVASGTRVRGLLLLSGALILASAAVVWQASGQADPSAATESAPLTDASQENPMIQVLLRSVPEGASVYEDGILVGKTPLSRSWPQDSERSVALSLPGYKELRQPLRLNRAETFTFQLQPQSPSPTPKPASLPDSGVPPKPSPKVEKPPPPTDEISPFE